MLTEIQKQTCMNCDTHYSDLTNDQYVITNTVNITLCGPCIGLFQGEYVKALRGYKSLPTLKKVAQ